MILFYAPLTKGAEEFTVESYSHRTGPGMYTYSIIDINEGDFIKWSWESNVPLDFRIVNPEGMVITSLKEQYMTSGDFIAQKTGTYHFRFWNYNDQEAHVSINVEHDIESEAFYYYLGIFIIIIIVIIVVIALFFKGRKQTA
jgi:hypothetical protein